MVDKPTRKFMFDRSFDGAMAANRVPERKPVTLKPEQLDEIKKQAYDAGFAAGTQIAADEHNQQLSNLLNLVERNISSLIENMQADNNERDSQTRTIILSIAKKLLPNFTARHGLQEIEKVLSDTIAEMVREPRLVVRVHQEQFDAINEYINAVTTQKAYTGKVIVLADEEIALGDCRVEWADGGLERNTQEIWNNVENVIAPEPTNASPQE